ncbi:hypothetical protein MUK42_35782 [Musa troglodytarum]|uniref:Uncharacterized protein n=1 Tax=Musa troglodytarum TaxID=320322 RepID=A0A9E7JTD9_9LILI|nr:hypothetical protein MUK42_35782 [Musa troglodytarum]
MEKMFLFGPLVQKFHFSFKLKLYDFTGTDKLRYLHSQSRQRRPTSMCALRGCTKRASAIQRASGCTKPATWLYYCSACACILWLPISVKCCLAGYLLVPLEVVLFSALIISSLHCIHFC